MAGVTGLVEERTQLFLDLFSGKTPARIPVTNPAGLEFAIQYCGQALAKCLWDIPKLEPVFDKFCGDFPGDTVSLAYPRLPSYYQLLGSKAIVMGSGGFLQHPEVEGMYSDEYAAFIAKPYDFLIETVLPRLYTALNCPDSQKAFVLARGFKAYLDDWTMLFAIKDRVAAKYGLIDHPASLTEAPFDFLADFLRGFKGICADIRRIPEEVEAACEAALPLMIKKGNLTAPSPIGFTFIPLHMAPYIREQDFTRLYWPTLKKLVEVFVAMGQHVQLFLENDWMRYLDYLEELPENTILRFEYGDPKLVAAKLGKKHIISGFYPITMLQTSGKQQCVDKAKELMDILGTTGKYWFMSDKVIVSADTTGKVAENLYAVLDYVVTNGKY